MDRALNIELLREALETHAMLPTPDQLQRLLAETEISLFVQDAEIEDSLLDVGWYLQSVATARPDLELYDLQRQRRAHQVSGHIFDLAVQSSALTAIERRRFVFAAQVGYLGGELTPNASAVARQIETPAPPFEWSDTGTMSLEAGIALLALDRPTLYPLLTTRRAQLDERLGPEADSGPLSALDGVIRGALELTGYLTYGDADALESAQRLFAAAMRAVGAEHDVDSRWVAAHLFRIAGGLATTSVWAVLPPDVPGAARALTLGDPPVLSLWPPQLDFLADSSTGTSPLDAAARRLVLSFPTSAGKTLLAQILIVTHIASADGEVCVVAPTHALCRELASSLDRRLRTLGYQLHRDDRIGITATAPPNARVTIMTPEKLAASMRSDPDELLARFSMFVIDEAHLVADDHRGWRLEETLSYLHYHTLNTAHRIVVLSAALGSQVHVAQWLDDGSLVQRHDNWRGPRRLNAIYTTIPDWDRKVETPAKGNRLARTSTPLIGRVHLSAGDRTTHGDFKENVGALILRKKKDGSTVRADESTKQRDLLVPLILHVAKAGPVLAVQATRIEAQRVAEAIAAQIDESTPSAFALRDLATNRLGSAHPLTSVLSKGVAFHHAALPTDIQAEIEDAVRSGQIGILVATTTLTEGVNLPFKTVVVGQRGYESADKYIEIIDAAALLNAVGRAGRAGRESEGWMIVAEHKKFTPSMFEQLNRSGSDLDMRSTLAADVGLTAMRSYQEQAASDQDAAFEHYSPGVDGFLSYIWFIAQQAPDESGALRAATDALRSTLAWQQLDAPDRATMESIAASAVAAFLRQDPQQRDRWTRTGTSLPTARTLDDIANAVLERCLRASSLTTIQEALEVVIDGDTLDRLLNLTENQKRGFKPHRSASKTDLVDVDIRALLVDWVNGTELQKLAERHLTSVADESYRYEQLAEFSANVLEHHLPWTIGILITWVNDRLEAIGDDR